MSSPAPHCSIKRKAWMLALLLVGCEDEPDYSGWSRNRPDAEVDLWGIPTAAGVTTRSVPRVDLNGLVDAGRPAASPDLPISAPYRPFEDALRLGFDISPRAIAVGQLTSDDRLDIVVSDGATLHVLAQTARGFVLARSLPLGEVPASVAQDFLIAADLNGDKHTDLAVNLGRAIGIAYFRGDSLDPLVTSHVPAPAADSFGLAVGKLAAERRNGLVALTASAAHAYLQRAAGAFAAPFALKDPAGMRAPVVVGDFDADLRTDVVSFLKSDELECVYAKALPGTGFAATVRCGLTQLHAKASGEEGIAAADLDDDGADDVVISRDGSVDILSLKKNRLSTLETNAKAGPVMTGDVDRDSLLDVLVENQSELLWYRSRGRISLLEEGQSIAAPARRSEDPSGILTDLDGDGQLDVLLGREDGLYVLYGLRNNVPREPLPETLPKDACVADSHRIPVTGCAFQCEKTPEVCNAKDDNCNGESDEGSMGIACGSGVGECSIGQIISCDKGTPTCSGKPPSDEQCDHLDNDCDGRVDETEACDPCRGPGSMPGSVIAKTDADVAALANVTCIGGQFQINGPEISDLSPLSKLRVVVGDMWITQTERLESLKGLSSLERVGRLFVRENRGLTTLVGVETLRNIDTFHLFIEKNSKLLDLNGLDGLEHVQDQLLIYDNPVLADMRGLRNVRYAAYVTVRGNQSLPQCQVFELLSRLETGVTCTDCGYNGEGSCAK